MKPIKHYTVIGHDHMGRVIQADILDKWAYDQLAIAPKLLEACKSVVEWAEKCPPTELIKKIDCMIWKVKLAISRTEGKS